MSPTTEPSSLITATVAERAKQLTAEQVRTECSLAQAERLLGREYHGRFLIELLQNAADAWRNSRDRLERSKVAIIITAEPALLVANQGESFPVEIVVNSLGHIGASSKSEGEAIGHKGIGFKSVLEITLTPELYSSLQAPDEQLALRFDPRQALELIRNNSPGWNSHVSAIESARADPLKAVPVLRFPQTMPTLPPEVEELAREGFETVIRLPFVDGLRPDPRLDEETWLQVVRSGLGDVTDQMLLLLGTFDEVVIDDRQAGSKQTLRPTWHDETELAGEVTRDTVTVTRNEVVTSRWRLYHRTLSASHGLAAEIAAGMRLSADPTNAAIIPPGSQPAAPFHLFFPTEISSGLPLLLHGYFKVNAARTTFYEGSAAENQTILDSLGDLVAIAVGDSAADNRVDLASLVNLLGAASEPEDPHARDFRARTLGLLDEIEWIPVEEAAGDRARPTQLLADDNAVLVHHILATFPASYVRACTDLSVPASAVDGAGNAFLASRRPPGASDLWETVGALARPSERRPWPKGEEDRGFAALLELLGALFAHDSAATGSLLSELRADPRSRLLPAVAADGSRTLLPVNDPADTTVRSLRVMARAGAVTHAPLDPPGALKVAFLADGVFDEDQIAQARHLGVRQFTVDNVLVRLGGTGDALQPPQELVRFLWALLVRERVSEFGTRKCARRAETFDPSAWFWAKPGAGDADRDRQQRERNLTTVLLPTRSNEWRPAGTLAFGSDWADWLESGACGRGTPETKVRATSYRALEAIHDTDDAMLAPPEAISSLLTDAAFGSADDSEYGPDEVALQRARERHAFLLRLGVWEVLPVEAFVDAGTRGRPHFPWPGELDQLRDRLVDEQGGWTFQAHSWSGGAHQNVFVSEDFRFRWSLEVAARKDPEHLTRELAIGSDLYSKLTHLEVFCPQCSSGGGRHRSRYRSGPGDSYPSILAIQVRTQAWVSAFVDGQIASDPLPPTDTWWTAKYPAPAGLRQSPVRYLKICQPPDAFTPALRQISGIEELGEASADRVLELLNQLRGDFDEGILPADPRSSNARQAFLRLHARAYGRLAQLATDDPLISERLARTGVLCEVGNALEYRPLSDVRHDNNASAPYRRYFGAAIGFVPLARDRADDAAALRIPPFVVELRRRGTDPGLDVTEEVVLILTDRLPELFAILVNYSLGAQMLELGSEAFEARANRVRRLRFRKLDDLVIDATVENMGVTRAIGQDSDQDLFLKGPTSPIPTLYFDLTGGDWLEQLRRKIAPHLAALLQSRAYSADFTVCMLADSPGEREAVLHERGITSDDVDAVRTALGIVSEEDRRRQSIWFAAIVASLTGASGLVAIQHDKVAEALIGAGLSDDAARRLFDFGDADARRDVSPEGPLWLLRTHGVDLADLDRRLVAAGEAGLDIRIARDRLREWIRQHERRVAAVLGEKLAAETAKAAPAGWRVSDTLAHELEPSDEQWLGPALEALRGVGVTPNATALATDAGPELARLLGLETTEELDDRALQLYDDDERRTALRRFAATWRRHLLLVGTVARVNAGDGPSAIRAHEAAVKALLPSDPAVPSELRPAVDDMLSRYSHFAQTLRDRLSDSLSCPPPDRDGVRQLAADGGLPTEHVDAVLRALDAPRNAAVREVRKRMSGLAASGLDVQPPQGLRPPGPKPPPPVGPRKVRAVKVGSKGDKRKRDIGDDAERWALAAVTRRLIELAPDERVHAIKEILRLLDGLSGTIVERVRGHAVHASDPALVEDELIDELTQFLHVSPYSDDFGFDMLGWLSPYDSAPPRAMYLEVKGTRDRSFHLSRGEWTCAQDLKNENLGEAYGVLVIHRSPTAPAPLALDLLSDPVELVETGQLSKHADGYLVRYAADART